MFTLDMRLCAAVGVFSLALAVAVLALYFRGRRWDEYAVGFIAVFSVCFFVSVALTNVLGVFPVIRLETVFPVP